MNLKSEIKKSMVKWWIIYPEDSERVSFEDELIPENAIGFVYKMKFTRENKEYFYIGKKNFYSNQKKKFGKKALTKVIDKRKKKYTMMKKLSYKNYFSSNKDIKQAYKDGIYIDRLILKICFSKAELTYQETKFQFLHSVLEKDEYLNGNILGRFYKGKV
jgi:hypothetical protein